MVHKWKGGEGGEKEEEKGIKVAINRRGGGKETEKMKGRENVESVCVCVCVSEPIIDGGQLKKEKGG